MFLSNSPLIEYSRSLIAPTVDDPEKVIYRLDGDDLFVYKGKPIESKSEVSKWKSIPCGWIRTNIHPLYPR